MTLAIGDTAPDFEADTTEGKIRFHQWLGNSWGLLFSHPKDFTPVCTTELGTVARLKPEFDKRNTKVIGLSVDPVDNHAKWAVDIKEVVGFAPNYPMIGDPDLKISKAYGMLPASTGGTSEGRTPADNQTVRNVFIIGPDKKIKLIMVYPMSTGRNFDEILRVLELAAAHRQAPRGDAGELETGRRRDPLQRDQQRRSRQALPARLQDAETLPACRADAARLSSTCLTLQSVGRRSNPAPCSLCGPRHKQGLPAMRRYDRWGRARRLSTHQIRDKGAIPWR